MSHLPLSLMNRLNKTESAVSNFGCCISKGSLFRLFRDHNSCRCAMWRPEKVSPYLDIVLLFLHFLVLCCFQTLDVVFPKDLLSAHIYICISRFGTEIKQDEYSTARQTLMRWSSIYATG